MKDEFEISRIHAAIKNVGLSNFNIEKATKSNGRCVKNKNITAEHVV